MEKKPSVKLNRLLEEEEKKTEIEDVFFFGRLSGEFITLSTEEITFSFHSVK